MRTRWVKILHVVTSSLLLAAACVRAPGQIPHGVAEQGLFAGDVFAGDLLIASPGTVDSVFRHAVIVIFHHDDNGTLGLIVNQPVEARSLAGLVVGAGGSANGVEGTATVFAGGPVLPKMGFVLHSADYAGAGTMHIGGSIAITTRPRIFIDIGHHKGPRKFLIAFGYAGWGPGQLENELARHYWFVSSEDPWLIFDDDRAKVWEDALARRGREI
jgi:putative transcriptional regulator